MSDEFLFADEADEGQDGAAAERPDDGPPWKILVADDDGEVHAVTRLALARLRFAGRGVALLSAYSGAEAAELLARESDVALVLLDVVMESDDAGLRLVRRIRDDMRNHAVRIILRTGQPGQAPEESVIVDYDINDYKAKTELTTQKLFTTVVAALRAYAHIIALETNRRGLQQIIDSTDRLFELHSMQQFAAGVLTQLTAVLSAPPNGIFCAQRGEVGDPRGVFVLAGAGRYAAAVDRSVAEAVADGAVVSAIEQALTGRGNIYDHGSTTLYIAAPDGHEVAAWIQTDRPPSEVERGLVEVFASKIAVSLANVRLYEKLRLANESLERRVFERTRELEAANARLELLAAVDGLTGALNRRRFLELAAQEVSRALRHGRPLSLLLFDLDLFKTVNDTYGHAAGDRTLRETVAAARAALRTADVLARFGGEEFVALLPETDLDGAAAVAERLRAAVAATALTADDGRAFSITTSVGVAQWRPDEASAERTLARADRALYAAKRDGRNKVSVI